MGLVNSAPSTAKVPQAFARWESAIRVYTSKMNGSDPLTDLSDKKVVATLMLPAEMHVDITKEMHKYHSWPE